jgi:hypothetical protein
MKHLLLGFFILGSFSVFANEIKFTSLQQASSSEGRVLVTVVHFPTVTNTRNFFE